MRIGKGGGAGCRMGLVGEVGSALKVAPFGKRRNAAPSLVHQTRNPRSDSAAALRRTCAARATTPADGATARLLPSYLTQLPPRPCHSLASSISTSGRPTTCDDRRRRRRRPSPPASQPHTAVATVTPAHSLEVLSSAGISQDITTRQTHTDIQYRASHCAYSSRPTSPIHIPPTEQLAR